MYRQIFELKPRSQIISQCSCKVECRERDCVHFPMHYCKGEQYEGMYCPILEKIVECEKVLL